MEHVYTGVRVAKPLYDKWHDLAAELGVSRNQVLSRLLAEAEVKSRPSVSVSLEKETRNAIAYQGQGEAGMSVN
jgi:hypothetical protein